MNWLQKLCDETGISRYRIYKEVGVPQTTLSTIVNEDKKIEKMEFGTVLKIAKAFNMTADELYKSTLK